jgi:gentisate 1,2-dioxygenase
MRQLIPVGTATDLQRHVHESIHYVISGTGYSEIGTSVVEWGPGDFVYTPPWIWHRHYAGSDTDVEMLIVENSRILDAMDANQRESLGNVSFSEHFGAPEA